MPIITGGSIRNGRKGYCYQDTLEDDAGNIREKRVLWYDARTGEAQFSITTLMTAAFLNPVLLVSLLLVLLTEFRLIRQIRAAGEKNPFSRAVAGTGSAEVGRFGNPGSGGGEAPVMPVR